MGRSTPPLPTKTELAILDVLWQRGPSTVREVTAVLARRRPTTYATVLKMLQIMHEKRLVIRDASEVRHVYAAARPAKETRRRLLDDFVDRGFAGSAKDLILHALASRKATTEELDEIRAELERFRERGDA